MIDQQTSDVVIVGGAAIGSSVACHLAGDPGFAGRICVIEKDPTYRYSASALSAASIRQQFSCSVNIRISLYGIAYLRDIAHHLGVAGETPAIDLHEGGYLYLATQRGVSILADNNALQRAEGADIELLDRQSLKRRFPWIDTDGIAAASFGRSGEGWFDGWALMQAFRRKARSLGVDYIAGEVVALERDGDRITGARLADGSLLRCGALVNCAGASGGRQVAAMAGVSIPVHARKRCVFTFTCKAEIENAPLIIDTSGVWCRPEGHRSTDGQMFICGGAPPEGQDPDSDDFDVDWPLFEEHYWPALATRIPAFEAIRPGRAWAGHYDLNMVDHNALIGRAPGLTNFYLANGFSGHGLQQAPAVGRGLAELIAHGRYLTLDLSDLAPERLAEGRPLLERNVI
jgi:FAD-dependent oxidoreductase domain-containing protein 1